MKYHTAPNSKTGPKRGLTLMEKFIITLVRLRPRLMEDSCYFFSLSQSQLRRIFTIWVCFLATTLKEVLVF